MSRTSIYNPICNGQEERYNGTIWKAITMSLKSNNLPIEHWQLVLPDVLHSVRSLLCTATNETPHERFRGFSRRSSTGSSIPSWLAENSSVYVKRNVRHSKFDPLVDEVDVLRVNPHYAHIRFSDGRKTTVSTKILAPRGEARRTPSESPESLVSEPESPSHASADPTQEHVTKVVDLRHLQMLKNSLLYHLDGHNVNGVLWIGLVYRQG